MVNEVLAMARRQGYAAVGAIPLAGFAFRGSSSPGTSSVLTKSQEIQASAAKATIEEGSWIASCRYWAAAGPFPSQLIKPSRTPPQINIELIQTDTGLAATMTGSVETPSDCGPDIQHWGIPKPSAKLEIHAIIAAV
jgi:hypothetical protein